MLDPEILLQSADAIRARVVGLDGDDEAAHMLVPILERCILALDRMHSDMTSAAFAKLINDLDGHASFEAPRAAQRSIPYKVAFLLKAMVLSSLLKSSADFSEVLEYNVKILLPASLVEQFASVLLECKHIVPHKSTISRRRLIMDGAPMLTARAENDVATNAEFVRYFMADSSMQHGRYFEVVVMRAIPRDSLPTLMEAAHDLIYLWQRFSRLCLERGVGGGGSRLGGADSADPLGMCLNVPGLGLLKCGVPSERVGPPPVLSERPVRTGVNAVAAHSEGPPLVRRTLPPASHRGKTWQLA